MPKYYIQSGSMQSIIDRENTQIAILAVLENLYGKGIILSPQICISEKGWNSTKKDCFDTDFFLKILYEKK